MKILKLNDAEESCSFHKTWKFWAQIIGGYSILCIFSASYENYLAIFCSKLTRNGSQCFCRKYCLWFQFFEKLVNEESVISLTKILHVKDTRSSTCFLVNSKWERYPAHLLETSEACGSKFCAFSDYRPSFNFCRLSYPCVTRILFEGSVFFYNSECHFRSTISGVSWVGFFFCGILV